MAKLTPGNSTIGTVRPSPEAGWNFPRNIKGDFAGTPPAGGTEITLTQPWNELNLDIQRNIIRDMIDTVARFINAALQVEGGDLVEPIKNAQKAVEDFFALQTRSINVPWEVKFTSETATAVSITHSITYDAKADITLGQRQNNDRIQWEIDSKVRFNGRHLNTMDIDLQGNLERNRGRNNDIESRPAVSGRARAGENSLSSTMLLRVSVQGFGNEVGDIIRNIAGQASTAGNLANLVAEYIQSWIDSMGTNRPTPAEVERRRREREEELKNQIKNALRALLARITTLGQLVLATWEGQAHVAETVFIVEIPDGAAAASRMDFGKGHISTLQYDDFPEEDDYMEETESDEDIDEEETHTVKFQPHTEKPTDDKKTEKSHKTKHVNPHN